MRRRYFRYSEKERLCLEIGKNPYATPMVYTSNPLLSGYSSTKNLESLKNSAGIIINGIGSGKVICMVDNPNFRAFWYGTNKLLANAIFFGNIIDRRATGKRSSFKEKREKRGLNEDYSFYLIRKLFNNLILKIKTKKLIKKTESGLDSV